MAEVTRQKKLQITKCSHCKHKTIKHIINKGCGG
jgi:ribosomal protein L32